MASGRGDRLWITGIRVADYAQARIGGQDTFQTPGCLRCAICYDDLPGMLAVPNPYATAVME